MSKSAGRKPSFPHDVAVQLVLDGWSIADVAERFGASEGAVHYALRKAEAARGERLPRRAAGRIRTFDRGRVFALLEGGLRQAEVARRIGASEAFVSRLARAHIAHQALAAAA